MRSRAEDLVVEDASFHLVAIGEAFHRMDQRVVAEKAMKWLAPDGCLAILGYEHIWHGTEEWKQRVCEALSCYKEPAAPPAEDTCGRRRHMTFEEVLKATGFSNIRRRDFTEPLAWDTDQIVSYLFSISIFSKPRLGDRAAEFESDVRQALRDADPSGWYVEQAEFSCLSAARPEHRAPV
jgi:hypothetical protein